MTLTNEVKWDVPFYSCSENINSSKHLNGSKLYLNFKGVKVSVENVSVFLKKFD